MTILVFTGIDRSSSFSSTPAGPSSGDADDAPAVDFELLEAGMRAAVDAVASAADFSVHPNTSLALQ